MNNREKRIEKLKKIKALAERGIGGEKEGAMQLYNKLLIKYEISESDITDEKIERHWVRFKSDTDRRLIVQLFYKVTGDRTYYEKVDKRKNVVGFDATEFEYQEFVFYYEFYKEHLKNELDVFMSAFINVNKLYPDSNARIQDNEDEEDKRTPEEIERDLEKLAKIRGMAKGIDAKTPRLGIESKED